MDNFPLKVFYNPYSIANILAFVDVTSRFGVTMGTKNEHAIFSQTGPDTVLNFYQGQTILYYFDTSNPNVINHF